jgi:hypothetical protein
MALDIFVVDDADRTPAAGFPSCVFVDRDHDYIFHHAGIDIYNRYPFLRRMIDFYADAKFGSEALDSLIAEIDDVLPLVSSVKSAVAAMESFRIVCVAARDAGKSLFVVCD